jgi:predicted PurR-regulated permease PerM
VDTVAGRRALRYTSLQKRTAGRLEAGRLVREDRAGRERDRLSSRASATPGRERRPVPPDPEQGTSGTEEVTPTESVRQRSDWLGEVRWFVLLLLVCALFLTYLVLRPFLQAIVFAAILASLCAPVQRRLVRRFGGRANLAASCVVLGSILVVALPLFLLLSALVSEGATYLAEAQQWVQTGEAERFIRSPQVAEFVAWVRERAPFLPDIDIKAQAAGALGAAGQVLLRAGRGLLANLAGGLMQLFIILFVMFYLVRDGRATVQAAKDLIPLQEERKERILERVRSVAKTVLLGSLLTGLCQGVAGGVGLFLVGLPGLFWGAVMAVASLIPVVGTSLVWVPATGYLLLSGRWKAAIFLAAWSVLLVGSIDNFLRPFLMSGPGALSPIYVFLAVLGGLQYFGLAGVLYGPLVLAFTSVVLYIYKEEFRPSG